MKLHKIDINDTSIAFWKQDGKLMYCTGAEQTFVVELEGEYIATSGGCDEEYDISGTTQIEFNFNSIGETLYDWSEKLSIQITESFYLNELLQSGDSGVWEDDRLHFDTDTINIELALIELGLIQFFDSEIAYNLEPEIMDAEDWQAELYINEEKIA